MLRNFAATKIIYLIYKEQRFTKKYFQITNSLLIHNF